MTTPSDNDLPLTANTDQALVRHWILDLDCCLEKKILKGSICLFLDLSKNGEKKQVFSIQEFQNLAENKEGTESKVDDTTNDPSLDTHSKARSPFHLLLECCDINIRSVHSLHNPQVNTKQKLSQLFQHDLSQTADDFQNIAQWPNQEALQFQTNKWSLDIWSPGISRSGDFPAVIRIEYETKPEGASLRWAVDQDGHRCMYTAGMWINSRSLIPCQEYGSLATWQAAVTVNRPAVVLMSGDLCESCTQLDGQERLKFHYQSIMPQPSFAFALAVGSWDKAVLNDPDVNSTVTVEESQLIPTSTPLESPALKPTQPLPFMQETCFHQTKCYIPYNHLLTLPCRIFAPASVLPRAVEEFSPIVAKYCEAVQEILGPFPFPRIDIMIYPACSQDMAMCNPNLLFLSQSVLAGDHSMASKLGHELSHYWFGLLMGAMDWTEEWLSEGFATYVEEVVQCRVMGWTDSRQEEYRELSAYLRYKTLTAELEHTASDLQTLRPNQGAEQHKSSEEGQMFIRNGMNPDKLFTQVHYLKGYFLLRWLESMVGVASMKAALREYVERHHGEMVRSHDFLNLIVNAHPEFSQQEYSVEDICRTWLDCSGIPEPLKSHCIGNDNSLYRTACEESDKWDKLDKHHKRMRSAAKRPKSIAKDHFCQLSTEQLILVLDDLLQKRSLCSTTLTRIKTQYRLNSRNADLQHKWCELVIKHLYSPGFRDVGCFLKEHQAMGVYLYGEMVISRCPQLNDLAQQCFSEVCEDMDASVRKMVHMMLYGESEQRPP